jgi:hypothetical protein
LVCIASVCAEPAAQGAACESNGDCASGLICPDLTCVAAHYPGDPCAADGTCTFGRCADGTCDYHEKVGQACAAPSDCATGECVSGLCYDDSICAAP